LAVGGGSVWTTTQSEPTTVFRVSPTTGSVAGEPWGTRDTGPLLVAHGSLWIGDFLDGSVARIDPSSGEATARIRVSDAQPSGIGPPTYTSVGGAFLNGLAADPTAVWVLTTSSIVVI
jgi:streptogramin lyase